jgi:CheY-like chemotaxis protein
MPKVVPSGTHKRVGRVLVIDDEPAIGRALRRVLGAECVVEIVFSADAGLKRLEGGARYDVVLCDLMMPNMDGIEFHRRLSKVLPEEARRIVFISGGAVSAHTARVESFFRSAPNLLLEKPIDLDGLRALIERRIDPRTPHAAGE